MIDPEEALGEKWSEYRKEFIPYDAGPNQKAALAYAFYRGMMALMQILHKATSTEPTPTGEELSSFMNGLETALSGFHDVLCPPEKEP
jgi:hypothetical protein